MKHQNTMRGGSHNRFARHPLMVGILISGFLFLAGEMFSRLILHFLKRPVPQRYEYFDHYLNWRYITPGGGVITDGLWGIDGRSRFVLDEHGFNMTAERLELPRERGELRIAVFGGSTVFGIGAPNSETTVPSQLQRLLRSRLPHVRVTVINAGVRGYFSFQELLYYITYVSRFQPNVVLSLTGYNDASYAVLSHGRSDLQTPHKLLRHRKVELMTDAAIHEPNQSAIFYMSALTRKLGFARLALHFLPPSEEPPLVSREADQAVRMETLREAAPWIESRSRAFQENLLDFRAAARNRGAVFMGVLQPALAVGKVPTQSEMYLATQGGAKDLGRHGEKISEFYSRVRTFFHSNSGFIDLSGIFRNTEESVYVDDCHWNSAGAAIIAEKLADLLIGDPNVRLIYGE